MRFLIDMPLSPGLVAWLAEKGHDAIHALDLGLGQAPDAEILARARSGERIVITADLDYPRLLAISSVSGPGLILFRGGDFAESEIVSGLVRAFEAIRAEDLARSIVVIDKYRIRRRRLPIEPSD